MSKISKYDILREYMYNEMCRLEGDVQQLQENIPPTFPEAALL